MATVNLGRIKPVFRGAFSNSTAYVIDDIVTSGNETFIAIAATQGNATTDASKWTKLAAKGADGTDVGATLANKEIAFKTNAGAVDGIPIGTAGQFLKVNSGATGYEYGDVTAKFVKAQKFHETTRYSIGSGSSDIALWTWGNFNKQSATSKLYYHGYCPGRRTENDHSFVKFTATPSSGSDETDNHNLSHGSHTSVSQMHLNLDGKFDTAFATGNVSLSMVLSSDGNANRGHSSGMIWNSNNSDDSRLPSTSSGSYLIVYEIED